MATPTLLIGIGGTGARIIDSIVAKARRDGVWGGVGHQVLILDTDKGELADVQHVDASSDITRFSTSETIYTILENNPGVEQDWMLARSAYEIPADQLNMSLDAGCRQVRIYTRVAMHNAVVNHRDNPERNPYRAITNKMRELKRHRQNTVGENVVKAVVFGSLAGATGSGCFSQIALMLRHAADAEELTNFQISGVFLMPDVFAKTVIPPSQEPNILSNGYASLKELNALNVLANMPDREADFTFEYLPGAEVRPGGQPYDQITLIDYESGTGAMSPELTNYMEMAARTGYILGFTAQGRRLESDAVNNANQIQEGHAAGKTLNVSGIGVAALTYPSESNKTYLTKRLVLENIKGNWTTIDRLVDVVIDRYNYEKQSNPELERPDYAATYLEKFDDLARNARTAFFKRIAANLAPKPKEDEGDPLPLLHITYLEAILKKVSEEFWNARELQDAYERRNNLNPTVFKAVSKIGQIVGNKEAELRRDYAAIAEQLRDNQPESKLQTLLQIAENPAEMGNAEWNEYDLQFYLIGRMPHPVQARVFLYRLKKEIEARLDDATRSPAAAYDNLTANAEVFRTREEKEQGSKEITSAGTASKANEATLNNAIEQFRRGRESERFVQRYITFYNSVVSGTKAYAKAEIDFRVMRLLLVEVNALLEAYRVLFAEIRAITSSLETDIQEAEQTYEPNRVGTDGNVWVYANGASRRDAWKRLEHRTLSLDIDETVNKKLAMSLYDIHVASRDTRRTVSFADIRQMFVREVVDTFGRNAIEQQFADTWDFSVIEAFRRQHEVRMEVAARDASGVEAAALNDAEQRERFNATLAQSLAIVRSQADPYILLKEGSRPSRTKYWAVSPEVRADLNDSDAFTRLFTGDGVNYNESFDYSKYEITCVSLAQMLDLTDLSKLDRGSDDRHQAARRPGRYYQAYVEHVATNLRDEETATIGDAAYSRFVPHIDKSWHRPLVLPEIDRGEELGLRSDTSRAYVIAEFLGLLDEFPQSELYAARLSLNTAPLGLRSGGVDLPICDGHDRFAAVMAFRANNRLAQEALNAWDQVKADDKSLAALQNVDRFHKLFEIASNKTDGRQQARERQTRENLRQWYQLLSEAVDAQNSTTADEGRISLTERRAQEVRNQLEQAIDGENSRYDDKLARELKGLISNEMRAPAGA